MTDDNGLERSGLASVLREAHSSGQDFDAGCDAVSLHCVHEQESLLAHFVHLDADEIVRRDALPLMDEIGLDANGTDY